MRAVISLGVWLLLGTAALGQSAEETVSFLLNGTEDGRKIEHFSYRRVTENPLTYILTVKGVDLVKFTVSQINACEYVSEFAGIKDRSKYFKTQVNFSAVKDIRPAETWLLEFADRCAVQEIDGSCKNNLISEYGVEYHRASAALAYFRANFCKGNAY
ncbi:hypothetical protein [Sinorhizobium meliloti]|uniref:hypothetical protein n=1 Tax=Rhizobium meliloti TaxID=382 RepID=UPI001295D8D8|nr:hypothetical protein [Sinorhizobium meliloti]MQX74646.1 hypothetical protein [Sinorhizobium meliloti]